MCGSWAACRICRRGRPSELGTRGVLCVSDGDGVGWPVTACVFTLGPGDRGFFHFDVIPIFDIGLMVKACLLFKLGTFALAFFRNEVGMFCIA
jgi:hypothetical protein